MPIEFDIHGLPKIRTVNDLSAHLRISPAFLWGLVRDDYNYQTYEVRKKSGGIRELSIPIEFLKRVQRWILRNILEKLKTTASCFGFSPGSKLRIHAEQHVGAKEVLTLDIKDFFPSISFARVVGVFRVAGFAPSGAWLLSRLCTWKEMLPQGAPTSPLLANLVCFRLDRRLAGFAKGRGLIYTRYADDMTFSSTSTNQLAKARRFVTHIVRDCGFELNETKTRLAGPRRSKVVTGLVLNPTGVGIGRLRLRELRAAIYLLHIEPAESADLQKQLIRLQGLLDFVSDVDLQRYQILVNYILRLKSSTASPLAVLRLRA